MHDTLGLNNPEITAAKTPGYLVVDAKAMFDTLSKGFCVASHKDKYMFLELLLLALSQHLETQQAVLLCCDSDHQLADVPPKSSKQDVLKRFLVQGAWRLRHDGAFSLSQEETFDVQRRGHFSSRQHLVNVWACWKNKTMLKLRTHAKLSNVCQAIVRRMQELFGPISFESGLR